LFLLRKNSLAPQNHTVDDLGRMLNCPALSVKTD